MTSKNAIIYARVSTSEQTKGFSLASQVKGCRHYAQSHNLTVIHEIQEDVTGAARLEERPIGKQLIEMAKSGEIEVVIVWRLDRLSRPPKEEYSRLLTTIEQFSRYGVTIHDCESGKVDTSMTSILIAFFKGLAASKEREAIRERSMRGKYEKASSGKWGWGGNPPFGYSKVGKGKDAYLKINEKEAKVVRRIFDLFLGINGPAMPLFSIAQLLTQEGIPTPGAKRKDGQTRWQYNHIGRRIIKNRRYLGEFKYTDITLHFPELAIIDEGTWLAAQERMAKNKKRPRRRAKGTVYLLAGRMKCPCGGVFSAFRCKTVTKRGTNIHCYYRCKRKNHFGPLACQEDNMRVDIIDGHVYDWLVKIIGTDEELEENISKMVKEAKEELEPSRDELSSVENLLKKAQNKVDKLVSAFGNSTNSAVEEALKREISQTTALIDSLDHQKNNVLAKIANAEITAKKKKKIRAIARKLRNRLQNGGGGKSRLELVELLDVQGKLYWDEEGKKLDLSCRLVEEVETICIETHSPA